MRGYQETITVTGPRTKALVSRRVLELVGELLAASPRRRFAAHSAARAIERRPPGAAVELNRREEREFRTAVTEVAAGR
jgi:hypothetical protein